MSDLNFSFELHTYDEALTGSGMLQTKSPPKDVVITSDFTDGKHFRTGPETGTNHLQLELEDRILTMIVDESGSMTWNDNNADRFSYLKRLLHKLEQTYPAAISTNIIGFGGVLADVYIFTAKAGQGYLTDDGQDTQQFIQSTFQNSVYDFAGVRLVRRTDRYPLHPADGVVVVDGIYQAAQDSPLQEGQEYYYGLWTFNRERHYSPGLFIRGIPRDRILPQGVNFASATPRILPGVERDDNVELMYNFQEGSGYLVFDSSGNGNHGVIGPEVVDHSFWAGDAASTSYEGDGQLKKAVGVRFDGEFDIIEADAGEELSFNPGVRPIVVSFWIYRYPHTEKEWIIGTSTEDPTNDIGWAIGVQPDGELIFDTAPSSLALGNTTGATIPENEWTMVVISFTGNITPDKVYVNGQAVGELDTSLSTYEVFPKLYIGAKPTNSAATWNGTDLFGSLAQISIHSTERSASYWADLYARESPIFDQSASRSTADPVDNNQREVLLNWIIGNDFDYDGGSVKILRKYREIPAHDEDGDVVATIGASEGEFFYLDSFDFVHNADYYYRVFTVNSIGSVCNRDEARVLSIRIPKSVNEDPAPPLETVSSESVIEGDMRIFLQWANPSDSRWVGTRVYFGIDRFPTVSISSNGELEVSDGTLLTDTTSQSYVHRLIGYTCNGAQITLTNGVSHFYTIITYDKYGRVSEPRNLVGIPTSSSSQIFPPAEVEDFHWEVINPRTLSLQWKNPTVRTSRLDLWFGETSLVFINLYNKLGGRLEDVDNMNLVVCTEIEKRGLKSNEQSLGYGGGLGGYGRTFNPRTPCEQGGGAMGTGFGTPLNENCNSDEEEAETVLSGSVVESGLIKGLLTHIGDREILSRRERYVMQVSGQYKLINPNDEDENIFEFNTESVTVTFQHPIRVTALNKTNRFITVGCEVDGGVRSLDEICICPDDPDDQCTPTTYNGAYARSSTPYICRVELQYKGEALPDGTPVNAQLFRHEDGNTLTTKSDRTFMQEGLYTTAAIQEEELGYDGEPTGKIVSKSIVDIPIPCPTLPDFVDLYVSLDFAGFLVDVVHEIRFISSLFLMLDGSKPEADGINVAEQFATVWQIDPDDPDPQNNVPVPDGTLVKWELRKRRNGKDRPFYSTEELPLINGVYSSTVGGVARNVFFGPVGNLETNWVNITCDEIPERCCLAEEYEIHASSILYEENAKDAVRFGYECEEAEFKNRHFFMNAAGTQPIGTRSSEPHYYTWADGEHLIKFEISRNPAITDSMRGWGCFINCTEEEQLFEIPEEHIAQITAPGEILWNVTFDEDPYTGKLTPIEYESVGPDDGVASIPLTGLVTDFYIRLNKFLGDGSVPKPQDCESGSGGGGGFGGDGNVVLPCEWIGYCNGVSGCNPTEGKKWDNVDVVSGNVTLIANNKQVTLYGGGDYENGIPPIYAGFQEPLDVRVVDARANGERVTEFAFDTRITFVVEARFAGKAVPDGTPIEVIVDDDELGVVNFSDCIGADQYCNPATSGVIYAQQVNDPQINPTGEMRSLAYFTIEPIANVEFSAKINVTCRYDNLGTAEREITRCVSLSNSVAQDPVDPPDPGGVTDPDEVSEQESAANSEAIVYNTVEDLYQRVFASQVSRMGHFISSGNTGTADLVYMFGGWSVKGTGSTTGITPTSEFYNVSNNEWEFTTDMPTARAYGMTVTSGDYIYCIGGIEKTENDQLQVSRKIEAFDLVTETWNPTLAPMPEECGVAFGDAQIVGDEYIYVICGVTSMEGDNKAGDLNAKILRYSISDDEWIQIEPSDAELYQRITPMAFLRNPLSPTTGNISTLRTVHPTDDAGYLLGTSWTAGAHIWGFGGFSSPVNGYIRYPVSVTPKSSVISAKLQVEVNTSISAGDFDLEFHLLDINDASSQDWSIAPGPANTVTLDYGDRFQGVQPAAGQVVEFDVTNLVQAYVNRNGYTPGQSIGIKIPYSPGAGGITANDADSYLEITYVEPTYYAYGGSVPKPSEQIENERLAKINQLLNEFRSFILGSGYYQGLSPSEQEDLLSAKEEEIRKSVIIPAFYYPLTGFKFLPLSEENTTGVWTMDISDTVDDEWAVLPLGRDHGQCVYIPHQDTAYFMGGSNQNQSTTLNRVESIDLANGNFYERRTPFNSGRSHFRAIDVGDEIYLTGGLKSGHTSGWVRVNVFQQPEQVEALGIQSCGMLITLTDDAGEIVEDPVRVDVRGRVRIPEIDSVLIGFLAERAAIRALGGEFGQGIPDAPDEGDTLDIGRLIKAKNSIGDPNSDAYQRNAASQLNDRIFLFPVIYSKNETIIENGVGGVTLLPRSEDPLAEFKRLATFIEDILQNTPEDTDERFAGDLTRDELAALGEVLSTVEIPPTVINSSMTRPLYDIETFLTVLDDIYFGQTISAYDLAIQEEIDSKIRELLTPPAPEDPEGDGGDVTDGGSSSSGGGDSGSGGGPGGSGNCFVLEHVAATDLPPPPPSADEDEENPFNPGAGGGGFSGSGQCLFCETILPTNPDIRDQLPTVTTGFYNTEKWVPQLKRYLVSNTSTIPEALDVLDTIDYQIPFGSSQLWDALMDGAQLMGSDALNSERKVIYICSDNSENLSISNRFEAIEEVNSVDGDRKTPVIYTVFSTSFPVSIAAMLQRSEASDVEALTQATGGQSSTLIATAFLDYILNLTLGGATGGLGYGIHTNILDLGELSSITTMDLDFFLPTNTQGRVRLRSSPDGFNYTDWSERFTGSGTHDFVDFFARYIEFEVVLTTGFTVDISEEYDGNATGIPKLKSITWETSGEKQDLLFVNTEDVLTNAQQVAMAFEGNVPTASVIELGVAASNSHQWVDFYNEARPIVDEFGKTFLLERDKDLESTVPAEPLITDDNIRYKTTYGPWDPDASVSLVQVDPSGPNANVEIPIFTGFRMYPRDGEVYFETRQPPDRVFRLAVVNPTKMRVGLRIRNRRWSDSIGVEGVGFLYSTNDEKPPLISQVAPTVLNATISPASPTADDTIFALYDYLDLNNDPESGTLLSWFKNNVQLFEIQNRSSWSNDDLLPGNSLVPNDKLQYTVMPSDGRDFGNPVYSPQVTVVARPPGAEDVKIVPIRNDVVNDRYDTSSTFTVEYEFKVDDTGPNALEFNTVIKWYVNGVLFKEGLYSEFEEGEDNGDSGDAFDDPKSIQPTDVIAGVVAHTIGNQIQVEVVPKTPLMTGETASSNNITVVNSLPIANDVEVTPLLPTTNSTLSVSYTIDDQDIDGQIQDDQSEIKWFSSANGTDFSEVTDLRNVTDVTPFFTRAGEYWYAQITPFDGLDLGAPVVSNTVTINA